LGTAKVLSGNEAREQMTVTLAIEIKPDLRQKLTGLAERPRRSADALAAEAVASYVEEESRILDGIARGRADMNAGRLVPRREAIDELDAAIASAAELSR
jgi:predicted transcriptional regulator